MVSRMTLDRIGLPIRNPARKPNNPTRPKNPNSLITEFPKSSGNMRSFKVSYYQLPGKSQYITENCLMKHSGRFEILGFLHRFLSQNLTLRIYGFKNVAHFYRKLFIIKEWAGWGSTVFNPTVVELNVSLRKASFGWFMSSSKANLKS